MGGFMNDVVGSLNRVRDLLLQESQQAASQGDWELAKKRMGQAQRADQLRDEIAGHSKEGPLELPGALESPEIPRGQLHVGRTGYPKYLIQDGSLIKRGLQRAGGEYEHAVPHERFLEIRQKLSDKASECLRGRPRPFTIEQIQRDLNCPRYMTYVVVSWLLHGGLLASERKGSYRFSAPAAFADQIDALWNQLKGATPS